MKIEYANRMDCDFIAQFDNHILKEELLKSIIDKKIIVARQENKICGWLRYNLFWDNTPFLNLIFIFESFRNKGIGKKMVEFWEKEMKNKKYKLIMTSTLSNELAQHFYRKLGYIDSGCLLLKGEPLEIIFTKNI